MHAVQPFIVSTIMWNANHNAHEAPAKAQFPQAKRHSGTETTEEGNCTHNRRMNVHLPMTPSITESVTSAFRKSGIVMGYKTEPKQFLPVAVA